MANSGKKKGFFRRLFLQDLSTNDAPYTTTPPNTPPYSPPGMGSPPQPPRPQPAPPSTDGAQFQTKRLSLTMHLGGEPINREMRVFPFPIGREELPMGITLDDQSVSSRHAFVDLQNGVLTITDTNSTNGTKVGDNIIPPGVAIPLNKGDVLSIGRSRLVVADFVCDGPAMRQRQGPLDQTMFMDSEPGDGDFGDPYGDFGDLYPAYDSQQQPDVGKQPMPSPIMPSGGLQHGSPSAMPQAGLHPESLPTMPPPAIPPQISNSYEGFEDFEDFDSYMIPQPGAGPQPPVAPLPVPPIAPLPVPSPGPMQEHAATRICKECGFKNKAAVKFCNGCGFSFQLPPMSGPQSMPMPTPPLTPPHPPVPGPGVPVPVSQGTPRKFCNKCGLKNETMGNFCDGCGNKLIS